MQGLLFHVAPVEPSEPAPRPLAGQVDLLDLIAEPAPAPAADVTWPAPVGALFTRDDLAPGVMVLA